MPKLILDVNVNFAYCTFFLVQASKDMNLLIRRRAGLDLFPGESSGSYTVYMDKCDSIPELEFITGESLGSYIHGQVRFDSRVEIHRRRIYRQVARDKVERVRFFNDSRIRWVRSIPREYSGG
jgi:hypothetical protein